MCVSGTSLNIPPRWLKLLFEGKGFLFFKGKQFMLEQRPLCVSTKGLTLLFWRDECERSFNCVTLMTSIEINQTKWFKFDLDCWYWVKIHSPRNFPAHSTSKPLLHNIITKDYPTPASNWSFGERKLETISLFKREATRREKARKKSFVSNHLFLFKVKPRNCSRSHEHYLSLAGYIVTEHWWNYLKIVEDKTLNSLKMTKKCKLRLKFLFK